MPEGRLERTRRAYETATEYSYRWLMDRLQDEVWTGPVTVEVKHDRFDTNRDHGDETTT